MDHIRNQQANDILEAMERLSALGYRLSIGYDGRADTCVDQRHVVMTDIDGDPIVARKATLRDALAHLIQILEV